MKNPSIASSAFAAGDVRIREIAATDSIAELTALLHRAYAPLGAMGLNYTAVDQSAETTARRVAEGLCHVATRGDALVGTVVVGGPYERNECAYYLRPGVASVQQFAVDPRLQGGGVGRLLLARAEAWARAQGRTEIALDTAEPATHLVDFYRRLGYAHVGHTQWSGKVYRSVVMSKPLARGLPTQDTA